MNLPSFYRFLRMRVFVLRIGTRSQKPEFRIAYAVAEPYSATDAPKASISQFSKLGHSLCYTSQYKSNADSRPCFIAVLTIIECASTICDIIKGLIGGKSLKDGCGQWGVALPENLDFNLYFSRDTMEFPPGIEMTFEGDITCAYTWRLLSPASMLMYNSQMPQDCEKTLAVIGKYIAEWLQTNKSIIATRVGNMEVLYRPACDADGNSLVAYSEPDEKTHLITLKEELYKGADEVIANVRFVADKRIMKDEVQHFPPVSCNEMTLRFTSTERPIRTDVKIWVRKGTDCRLVHQHTTTIIRQFNFDLQIVERQLQLSTEWHRKIRESLPSNKQKMVDDVSKITRMSHERFLVGDSVSTHGGASHRRIKPDDAFFSKGWNPGEGKGGEHGALEFLTWFKERTMGAADVLLQDPYIEDVALWFIASSESAARYTVITQTGLKTNSDGTAYVDDASDLRGEKILVLIRKNPSLFAGMQLVIKNLTGISNKLHDRYLIISYADGHTEGYTLSNSLQGATTKQPLLATRIGDSALEKLMAHLSTNIAERTKSGELKNLYDSEEYRRSSMAFSKEIADPAFLKWIKSSFCNKSLIRETTNCMKLIANDILHGPFSHPGAIAGKISTLGYLLANTPPNHEHHLEECAIEFVRDSQEWVTILQDFILDNHAAEFPIGFSHCPSRGWLNLNLACLVDMDYREVLSAERIHLVENSCCEHDYFSTWGQHYACKILVGASPSVAADTLLALRSKTLNWQGDQLINPTYLATNMLLQEMCYSVVVHQGETLVRTMLSHNDRWIRSIGGLMMLYCAVRENFKIKNYKRLFTLPEEIITLAHSALYVIREEKDRDTFYEWICDEAKRENGVRLCVLEQGLDFLKGRYNLDNKRDYVIKVLKRLVMDKILHADEVERMLTDALYNPAEESESMSVLLPTALTEIGASMSYLMERINITLRECEVDENRQLLKDKDSTFRIMIKRHNIEPLLAWLDVKDV